VIVDANYFSLQTNVSPQLGFQNWLTSEAQRFDFLFGWRTTRVLSSAVLFTRVAKQQLDQTVRQRFSQVFLLNIVKTGSSCDRGHLFPGRSGKARKRILREQIPRLENAFIYFCPSRRICQRQNAIKPARSRVQHSAMLPRAIKNYASLDQSWRLPLFFEYEQARIRHWQCNPDRV
jgi:hypothetical protein